MGDSMNDFLDFGDDQSNAFADEYANLNRCDDSPSSEEMNLNPMESSYTAQVSADPNSLDLEMRDFSIGSNWSGVSDSFSHMHVKAEVKETAANSDSNNNNVFDSPVTIPGSWPTARTVLKSAALRNQIPVAQNPQLLQPSSFTMSQIAPPSLPQEHSNSTNTSSICSDTIKEEDEAACHVSDLTEPAKKRRASETVRKLPIPPKATHKRSNSNASSTTLTAQDTATALPVGVEFDESGDPIVAKRQDRLMRNRAAALASRERKREHVQRLESSVTDLENDKSDLQKQIHKMHGEILRLRKLLADGNIEDTECPLDLDLDLDLNVPEISIDTASEEPVKAENADVTRARAAPTGFSPRGALKKSEIIANQIRAEEHLRSLTMKQNGPRLAKTAATTAGTTDSTSVAMTEDKTTVPVTIEKHHKTTSGGSVVFMILIFGIALFANTNSTGSLNLTGFSRDPSTSGLLLNLPQNIGEVCPETVISQLRGQGFMLSEEIEDLEVRNLLTADTRAGSVSSTTSSLAVAENDIANWITTHNGGELAHEVGKTFTIAAPSANTETKESTPRSMVSGGIQQQDASESKKWTILECEIKRVQDLNKVMMTTGA